MSAIRENPIQLQNNLRLRLFQMQRGHPSQTDVISSALQTMSFPKTDVSEYEKEIKLTFNFESEILNDTQSSKSSKEIKYQLAQLNT